MSVGEFESAALAALPSMAFANPKSKTFSVPNVLEVITLAKQTVRAKALSGIASRL